MKGRGDHGGGKRNAVMFSKPDEPAFLKRMKEQLGYKEGPSIDTKRELLPALELGDTKDKDDEKPTIVVIEPGDLTAEQVEQFGGLREPEDAVDASIGGKLIFKKPVKRAAEALTETGTVPKLDKKESSSKQINNKSLLSFDDEENDD